MAEETEGSETRAQASGVGVDPAAVALALGGASREDASAFLKKQGALVDLQAKELSHELGLRHWSLWVRHVSGVLKLAFEFSIALVLLGVVALLANEVWDAAHNNGLVIEAFSVPPDLAARGLTGAVVASELLDRLGQMEAQTEPTAQSEGTYRLDLADNVRIEIPETGGLSLGEIDRYLREKLGNETHVRGEIVRTPAGLTMFVRAGAAPGLSVEGSEKDLAGLISKSAENLFAQSEPLRYCDYLTDNAQFDEAIRRLRPMTLTGTAFHRAEALTNWAEALDFSGHGREARDVATEAVRLVPYASFAWAVVSDSSIELGHEEEAYRSELEMVRTARQAWSADDQRTISIANYPKFMQARAYSHGGDLQASARAWARFYENGANGIPQIDSGEVLTEYAPLLAKAHELARASQLIRTVSGSSEGGGASDAQAPTVANVHPGGNLANYAGAIYARAIYDFYASDWAGVAENSRLLDAADQAGKLDPYTTAWRKVNVWPLAAIALTRLGDIRGAEQIVARSSADCDPCLRARGWIAAAKGDWHAADFWFGAVAARSPSIPFADTDWGEVLLRKGNLDNAAAKFKVANAISPHFADPLEMWGEALMTQNRSDRALAKFTEAEKYAPNWGRLHLKWGEALGYTGRKDEAQKQYQTASTLDLSAADKTELARQMQGKV